MPIVTVNYKNIKVRKKADGMKPQHKLIYKRHAKLLQALVQNNMVPGQWAKSIQNINLPLLLMVYNR